MATFTAGIWNEPPGCDLAVDVRSLARTHHPLPSNPADWILMDPVSKPGICIYTFISPLTSCLLNAMPLVNLDLEQGLVPDNHPPHPQVDRLLHRSLWDVAVCVWVCVGVALPDPHTTAAL